MERGAITVSLLAGGSAFTRLQTVTVENGGSFPGSLALSTTTALGGEGTYWLRDWLGLRVQASYAPGEFQLRMSEEGRDSLLGADAGPSDLRFSDIAIYTYDARAVVALPFTVQPARLTGMLGVGGATFVADDKDAGGLDAAMEGASTRTRLSGVIGLGLRIPLRSGRVALSFELTDHVARSPVPANDGRILLRTDRLRVVNDAHPASPDDSAYYLHDVSFFGGLVFRLREGRRPQ